MYEFLIYSGISCILTGTLGFLLRETLFGNVTRFIRIEFLDEEDNFIDDEIRKGVIIRFINSLSYLFFFVILGIILLIEKT